MLAESSPYLTIFLLMLGAVAFALAPLGLAWLWAKKFSPRKPGPDKNAIYECGLESKGDAWIQFRSEYYLYAIIFPDFRCGNDLSAALCGGIYRLPVGPSGDDGFFAAAGGRPGLGVAERGADLEMKRRTI